MPEAIRAEGTQPAVLLDEAQHGLEQPLEGTWEHADPLGMIARITRNGTRGTPEAREAGRVASNAYNALSLRYRDEDREAGRMDWAEYTIRRFKLGFEPLK